MLVFCDMYIRTILFLYTGAFHVRVHDQNIMISTFFYVYFFFIISWCGTMSMQEVWGGEAHWGQCQNSSLAGTLPLFDIFCKIWWHLSAYDTKNSLLWNKYQRRCVAGRPFSWNRSSSCAATHAQRTECLKTWQKKMTKDSLRAKEIVICMSSIY